MKNNPLISIVTTYFNKREFISETLESILKQTYKNFELILVYDDGNKKDLKFIKNLLKKFKKKKLIVNNKNLGVSVSRNIAINYCKGKFLAFIDADDLWLKNKLKIQLNLMLKGRHVFSYSSYNVIGSNGKFLATRHVSKDINYLKLIKSCEIGLSTVMIQKKLFKQLRFPNLKTQEDFALWLKLLRKGYKFFPIKKILSYWRVTENSLSSNKFQKLSDSFKLFYRIENKNLINSIFGVIVLAYNKILKI